MLGETGIREFQLDVNDYQDIVAVMRDKGLPAYLFHVQVTDDYTPPTKRSVGRDIWWVDLFSLRASFKKVATRRDERKLAAYFDPSVFRPLNDFPAELAAKAYEALRAKLTGDGIDDLPA